MIDLHNSYNKSVLGIHPKTSLCPHICFGREKHPSVQGIAVCTGPERIILIEKHNVSVKRYFKKSAK